MKTIYTECLDQLVIVGGRHLRYLIGTFLDHYLAGRYHQGLDGQLIRPPTLAGDNKGSTRTIQCCSRLGGQLNLYYRGEGRDQSRRVSGPYARGGFLHDGLHEIDFVSDVVQSSVDRANEAAVCALVGAQYGAAASALLRSPPLPAFELRGILNDFGAFLFRNEPFADEVATDQNHTRDVLAVVFPSLVASGRARAGAELGDGATLGVDELVRGRVET